ncbi:MAG TPA: hypothetical protein VFA45_23275 [Actinomycetes bacterium]|jgi:hypothetical protein|nr:hypothetical protein [Actinomycetes bacterium]
MRYSSPAHGEPAETGGAVPPEATAAPPSQPPPTAGIPAAKPALGESTPSSPAPGSSAVGGGNLRPIRQRPPRPLARKEIAFADHEMDKTAPMRNPPFSGSRGVPLRLLGGCGLVALGALTLLLSTRRARKPSGAA